MDLQHFMCRQKSLSSPSEAPEKPASLQTSGEAGDLMIHDRKVGGKTARLYKLGDSRCY
jgi:hypothetical protein